MLTQDRSIYSGHFSPPITHTLQRYRHFLKFGEENRPREKNSDVINLGRCPFLERISLVIQDYQIIVVYSFTRLFIFLDISVENFYTGLRYEPFIVHVCTSQSPPETLIAEKEKIYKLKNLLANFINMFQVFQNFQQQNQVCRA